MQQFEIPALSLWQPWASLIATGAKTIETRGWRTDYRGPLLICSSNYKPKELLQNLLGQRLFQGALAPLVGKPLDLSGEGEWPGVGIRHLDFGAAVAVVDLVACHPTSRIIMSEIGADLFGDFENGRYGWFLMNPRRVHPSFPIKGRQRLFKVGVTEEFCEQYAVQLSEMTEVETD